MSLTEYGATCMLVLCNLMSHGDLAGYTLNSGLGLQQYYSDICCKSLGLNHASIAGLVAFASRLYG